MLSDRRQRVLRALIEEYVACALPVGSRTLTEHYSLGVSSATVRNDLSALETQGYIRQPHTSAGRVPTDAGYRAFVDDLLAGELGEEEHPFHDVVMQIRQSADAIDDLIERTSAEMSRLTDCLSIVTAPSVAVAHVRQVSLISLDDYRALIVVVSDDGQVANRYVTFPEPVSAHILAQIEEGISSFLKGSSLTDIDVQSIADSSSVLQSPASRIILENIACMGREENAISATRVGISSLMRKPEFHDSQTLLPLMEILEDNTVFFRTFASDVEGSDSVMVRIGRENSADALSGVSVIAGKYGRGASSGVVAVIGPTRMDYTQVIRAVRAAQDALGEI